MAFAAISQQIGSEVMFPVLREQLNKMRFEDHIAPADGCDVVGASWIHGELAIAVPHGQPALLHRGQVRTSCDQHHVLAAAGEMRPQQTADRPGADDRDFH